MLFFITIFKVIVLTIKLFIGKVLDTFSYKTLAYEHVFTFKVGDCYISLTRKIYNVEPFWSSTLFEIAFEHTSICFIFKTYFKIWYIYKF